MAYWGLKGVAAAIPEGVIPQEAVIGLSPAGLLFALGVTAYEVFTSTFPWERSQSIQTLQDHVNLTGRDPRDWRKDLPEPVARFLMKAIDRDPQKRFQTPSEFREAIKALPTPPRRSVLILFVAGEEQGLLGSLYFSQHPIVPTGKIAADINYDGGNIWGRTRDVTYVGKGKTTLDPIVDEVARRQGRAVKPDQFPDRGAFYRSDQFSFARTGVPGVYLGTGLDFIGRPEGWGREQIEHFERTSYHQPSDEIRPDWNFDGMIENDQLGFALGVKIANGDALPAWLPGDEFEAARKAALAR